MGSPADQSKGRLLQSWKEIAAFLGVTVRSAQRWEQTAGLPVYRLHSGKKGRVFAYTEELLAWRQTGGAALAEAEEAAGGEGAGGRPAHGLSRRGRYGVLAVALLAAAGLALLGRVWLRTRSAVPEEWVLERTRLRILDREGRTLWEKRFAGLHGPYYAEPGDKALIADIDGDRRREVLFFYMPEDPARRGGSLLCFEQNGRLRWERLLGAAKTFRGREFTASYAPHLLRTVSAGGTHYVLAVANHYLWFPSQTVLLDAADGRLRSEYWHPGAIRQCLLHDLDRDGIPEVILGGINNPGDGMGHAAVAVLKIPFRPAGPPAPGEDGLGAVTGGGEQAYALFPLPDVCRIQGVLPIVSYLGVDGRERIVVKTPIPDGGAVYQLDARLNVLEFRLSDNFAPMHERLRRQGVLDHPLTPAEIASLGKVMRFAAAPNGNSPALKRFWAF
jgi:hypothetical protein